MIATAGGAFCSVLLLSVANARYSVIPLTAAFATSFLKKAHNLVTYEELMVAAGHLKETKLDFDKIRDYVSQKTGISDEELIGQIKAAAERFDKIPILGTIRAGLPILSEGNCEELIDVPSNVKADFGLRITGDSMAWVGIHQGDIALFKESSVGSHGQIVAAGVEAETWEANLKFYIQQNGKVFLRSVNPNYEDIVYGPNHRKSLYLYMTTVMCFRTRNTLTRNGLK